MRRRSFCRKCGGSALCIHGWTKYGSPLRKVQRPGCLQAWHAKAYLQGLQRWILVFSRQAEGAVQSARECGGSVFCHHNKRWRICREWKGVMGGRADMCAHGPTPVGKIKYQCRACAPPGCFCIQNHDCLKTRRKECKGGSICAHKFNCQSDSSGGCRRSKGALQIFPAIQPIVTVTVFKRPLGAPSAEQLHSHEIFALTFCALKAQRLDERTTWHTQTMPGPRRISVLHIEFFE